MHLHRVEHMEVESERERERELGKRERKKETINVWEVVVAKKNGYHI